MARRYRRRKQDNSALATVFVVALLGVGINQHRSAVLQVLLGVIICALLVGTFMTVRDRRRQVRLARSGINEIDAMAGVEFEKYLQTLLRRKGYKNVKLTTTYDLGVDLIGERDGVRWAIQAKRYTGAVGLNAVRQVVAAASHYKCDRAMVITNSYFTRNARTIAQSTDCVLIDRDRLIVIILSD